MVYTRYKKHAGGVFDVKYHFVWCPKYRRKVLTGKIVERLREVLSSKAKELGQERFTGKSERVAEGQSRCEIQWDRATSGPVLGPF